MIRILVALALLLSSCTYTALEERIAKLEKTRAKEYMALAGETGARRFWWTNSLTGASDSLDSIDCTALTNGDMALVGYQSGETGQFYVYHYYSSGTHTTDSPIRIVCDGDGGAWYLCNVYVQSIVGNAADGYRYFQAYNSTTFDGTPAEGYCYWRDDNNELCCYDADATAEWRCIDFDESPVTSTGR